MELVRDIMTKDPACCVADTSLQDVARMMVEFDCGEIPVVDDKESRVPVGVITDRDICCRTVAQGLNPLEMVVADCMTTPCVTITESASLDECLELLEDNQIRRIPVVNQKGKLCGIVTQADIVRKAESLMAQDLVRVVSTPSAEPSNIQ